MGWSPGWLPDRVNTGRSGAQRKTTVQNSIGIVRNRERSLLGGGPSWKCRQIWRAQTRDCICTCWLALHVCLCYLMNTPRWLARLSLPRAPPCPCQPILVQPHYARQGNHEPHLIPFCPIMALVATPPAPLFLASAHSLSISTFRTTFHPISSPSAPHQLPSDLQHAGSPVQAHTHSDLLPPTLESGTGQIFADARAFFVTTCCCRLAPYVRPVRQIQHQWPF